MQNKTRLVYFEMKTHKKQNGIATAKNLTCIIIEV